MNRRSVLKWLASLPLVGLAVPKASKSEQWWSRAKAVDPAFEVTSLGHDILVDTNLLIFQISAYRWSVKSYYRQLDS